MEDDIKVFHSDITKGDCKETNHLYDLLKVEPAKPIVQLTNYNKKDTWEFCPIYNKQYQPRKGSKLKVKTVRDIRSLFEYHVNTYLPKDLQTQHNYLLRKICDGYSNNDNTKKCANKILHSDTPISRTAWQMLSNINPGRHNHPKQFILWNGKCIQVNGSKGGKNKFIYNHDLKYVKKAKINNGSVNFKKKVLKSRMGLLRNSLNVKFKPGPLGKKKFLDRSQQKYQMNSIETVTLPKPVLDILPVYGTIMEPTISTFINDLRGETGLITQKLAEFSVSALGTVKDGMPIQLDNQCCISFDLKYKCNQNRILMRRNNTQHKYKNVENDIPSVSFNISNIMAAEQNHLTEPLKEIKNMMNEMLNSVEIGLLQDSLYSTEIDESTEVLAVSNIVYNTKDKPKRKYCELDKLDVTVIKLPESSEKDNSKSCIKDFCRLGCICESLNCTFNIKQHCGVLDCMFNCKCEVSRFKDIELLGRDYSELIPGLLRLDNEINSHLAKEEQKFHQTVIFSGDKSIVLKSRKRSCQLPKKYSEFYNTSVKNVESVKRILTVNVLKLDCRNIEPYCMVHNLYKCFCRGKFTESSLSINQRGVVNVTVLSDHSEVNKEINTSKNTDERTALRPNLRPKTKNCEISNAVSDVCNYVDLCKDSSADSKVSNISCARTLPYKSRKNTDDHYKTTNKKIKEMEKNDKTLQMKLLKIINCSKSDEHELPPVSDTTNNNSDTLLNEEVTNKSINGGGELNYPFSNNAGKSSFKDWLEFSYKSYKERLNLRIHRSLEAPKKGKASLQSWDFILSRYRERKNIFFVSTKEPFHTFLAVDAGHPYFKNCINIDDIRFADLHKYPIIIRNLVTNVTDSENSFCILRGWDHCWELIGSAVKVIERVGENQFNPEENGETETLLQDDILDDEDDNWDNQDVLFHPDNLLSIQNKEPNEIERDFNNTERSKWFVMSVEKDFTEIQFFNKGFYVTYDGIQRSICIARISGKTVRLSSQTHTDKNSTHQFGIYAIPSTNECCVFIGPYEIDEPLGIEVVKVFSDERREKKTRGIWITTNKVDDMKVIERPLSFMPSTSIPKEAMVTLDASSNISLNTQSLLSPNNIHDEKTKEVQKTTPEKEMASKLIKPIKIRRTNGFYHLSNSLLQKMSPNRQSPAPFKKSINFNAGSIIIKDSVSLANKDDYSILKNNLQTTVHSLPALSKPVAQIAPQMNSLDDLNPSTSTIYNKPVAEISPQIKITAVYSQKKSPKELQDKSKVPEMLILNPEEINNKVLAKVETEDEISTDIEKFLETSTICTAPQDEIFVISDCEEENTISWKDVWIVCSNVNNFGCIPGRLNDEKLLSFEFPGFKFSEFYSQSQAFRKINQVLARKIYKPNNITLKWQVIKNKTRKQELKMKILTTECLKNKGYLLERLRLRRHNRYKKKLPDRTYSRSTSNAVTGSSEQTSWTECGTINNSQEAVELFDNLEETSKELDNQNELLWNEAMTKRDELVNTLNISDNVKDGMTETLKTILSLND